MGLFFRHIYESFSMQLVLLHLRSNLLLLSLWIIMLMLMSGGIGGRLGFQYLFLDPEYLGEVGFLSFFIVGSGLGGFFMSWNLTTYLLTAHYFPFLASLARPFAKFSINNLVFPVVFGAFYLGLTAYFQYNYEDISLARLIWHLLALVLGLIATIVVYAVYFHYTNKDILHYQKRKTPPPNLAPFSIVPGRRNIDIDYIKLDKNRIPVKTYLNEKLRPRLVRSVAHYESKLLRSIFKQNHLNALTLQLISMMSLLLLGYLIDWHIFRIPAAASLLIIFSILIAVIGALTYWFAEWRALVIILLLVAINYLTSFGLFNHPNQAYGLNYKGGRAVYSYERMQGVCFSGQIEKDIAHTSSILDNRLKTMIADSNAKPKIVLLCASGGGLKAATWSTHVIQTANRLSNGRLLDQNVLMTGASGGMLGMAYLREIYRRNEEGDSMDFHSSTVIDDISSDLLNSIAFSIVSNDLFLPWNRFDYKGQTYFKDRGYVLEQQLNENTHGLLDFSISAYQKIEQEGRIPLLYLTPSIVNDGRQMVISPQGVSFMMIPPIGLELHNSFKIDAVDFRWLLGAQQADSLRFLTALRMNATYPYVLPTVHLPTEPEITLVDAGFRDNYGISAATRFIQVYQDWIRENTSGVILVQISSSEKIEKIEASGSKGVIGSLFDPLGIAGKVLAIQEYQHDNSLSFIYDMLGADHFELIRFIYHPTDISKLEATVSFHLTERERKDVINALELEENQQSLKRLVEKLRE